MILSACSSSQSPADAPATALSWTELDPLPDAIGFKGMFGGVSNGYVVAAGGSNFPTPPSMGAKKTFYTSTYIRALPISRESGWRRGNDLPFPIGEGATVTTEQGIICIGGHDGRAPVASVVRLRCDPRSGEVAQTRLIDLPTACANAAATYFRGALYVAGGESAGGALHTFWRLTLGDGSETAGRARWEGLPSWPAAGRFGGILIPVTTKNGERLLFAGGIAGPAKSQSDYLRDAWLFDADAGTWTAAAAMPRGAVLGAAIETASRSVGSRVLVLGGSDGHDFSRMKALGARYRIPSEVLAYDALANTWHRAGDMPLGVVGAAIIRDRNQWLVVGGEYSPGLRTPRVFQLRSVTP